MAVGDGGFRQVALGFDKNEVNAYISDLRKKMKSMEEDMKANNKKTEDALKLAEEAEDRIKAAVGEVESQHRDTKLELTAEQQRNEELKFKLEKAENQLKEERQMMTDMLKNGKGVSSEAQKAYTEIIDKANDDADAIIQKANDEAKEIIAAAEERRAAADANTQSFLSTIKSQIDGLTAGYKSISESAAELLGAQAAPLPVAEFAAVAAAAAVAEAPKAAPKKEKPAAKEEPVEEIIEEITAPAIEEPVIEEPAEQPAAEEAPAMPEMEEAIEDNGEDLASFDDVWGGSEIAAQTIYNSENKDAVPLVNPDAMDSFGKDIFGTGIEESNKDEEIVSEIQPLEAPEKQNPVDTIEGFENDLIAQTMPSGSLGANVNEDLLRAVQEAEAAFAVQPRITDLSMDEDEEEEEISTSSEDDLMKALREAEEALNSMSANPSMGASMDEDEVIESSDSNSDANDPWADLQKQFEAMEKSGNFTDDVVQDAPEAQPQPQPEPDPAVPTTDDSSIWDFSDSGDSSGDDDMSSDMFGGFGGF